MKTKIVISDAFPIVGSDPPDHVNFCTEYVDASNLSHEIWEEGLQFFERKSDSSKLNRISDKEFEIVKTGQRIFVE
jgi:hypothetical protein